MAMSKSYPIFLLLIFLGLFAWVYQSENSQLQVQQQQELDSFKTSLTRYQQWQGDGAEHEEDNHRAGDDAAEFAADRAASAGHKRACGGESPAVGIGGCAF